jgi:tetratricopeptide (TPR) repeat protein
MGRGNELLKAKRYEEAIAAYEEGFRTYPDRAFLLNKATALLDSGRFAEAVLAYDRYLSDPTAPRADEAREAQERARAHLGGREPTMAGIEESGKAFGDGLKAYQAGKYEEALAAFERAYELNPLAATRYNVAACLDKLGMRYSAIESYKGYLAMAPDAKDAAKVTARIGKLTAEAATNPITLGGYPGGREWMTRGNQLIREGRFDEAVAAFEEGFRTYPDAKFILNKASALLDGGRYAEADMAYGRYLADPNAARADEARAAQQRARAQMGGHEATLARMEKMPAEYAKGVELHDKGRYAEALEAFNRAYELDPRPEIRYNQATCLDRMGQREAAAKKYDDYVAQRPHAQDAQKVAAHAAKLHNEAKTLARDAFDRGQIAFKDGRFRDAAMAFAEAYEHLPLPEFIHNKASALDKAGETVKAVREYQLYLNASPNANDADRIRTRIDQLQRATGTELMRP